MNYWIAGKPSFDLCQENAHLFILFPAEKFFLILWESNLAAGSQISPMHFATRRCDSLLHTSPRCKMPILLLHHAAGSQILLLHHAAGSQISLLHHAAGSKILPLQNAAGSERKFLGNISPQHDTVVKFNLPLHDAAEVYLLMEKTVCLKFSATAPLSAVFTERIKSWDYNENWFERFNFIKLRQGNVFLW
jgi:hypothetical protein